MSPTDDLAVAFCVGFGEDAAGFKLFDQTGGTVVADLQFALKVGDRGLAVRQNDLLGLFEEAKQIVLTDRKTSISYLQRKLQIGYNRSARLIEQLESRGILSEPNAKGNREIVGG